MSENVKALTKHFKDVRQELRKVHWPNRRELTLFTSMVLMAIFFIGVFFWILDSGFAGILRIILQR
ncbi:MAG: preprotein translocase subunit SecE [Dethiobacter sp.]|jgi:preprotein translocase subunit SecE|nr:preprotein translocase subunit SecE [Dethiobacter sp.]MBS3902651.1 preprotein translocase subunit SecE [Dethiobacter sp.]